MEAVIGIPLLGISLYMFLKSYYLKRNGIQAIATVTDIVTEYNVESGGNTHYPVLKYAVSGVEYTKKHTTSNWFMDYKPGQTVTIYYNKENPQSYAIPGDKGAKYALAAGVFCIMLGLLNR